MTKPSILYLLKVGFSDPALGPETYFCPYCIQVEGFLSVFPEVHDKIRIEYVDFGKPRGDLARYSGDANQSCPQIVFPDGDDDFSAQFSDIGIGRARRIHKTMAILDYLADRFLTPKRHP